MKLIIRSVLAFLFLTILSCNNEIEDFQSNLNANDFLLNIPVSQDTFLVDNSYNIDFRVEIKGCLIDSVFIYSGKDTILKSDTFIISTDKLYLNTGLNNISFIIRAVNIGSGKTVFFKSKSLLFNCVDNLSNRFVSHSVDNGRLRLTWKGLDESNTQKYIVERWVIDDKFNTNYGEKKYLQTYEVENTSFVDNYYVGEEVEYKITVLNKEGNKQDIWYYKKSKEQQYFYVTQNPTVGYTLHFSKCKYFNNLGQYYFTDGYNSNPKFIYSTSEVNDTIYNISNAKFAGEARFWLRYLPKQLPDNFSKDDWNIYANFVCLIYGLKSFAYENISELNDDNVVITYNGKIFKYNLKTNSKTDSIVNKSASYGFLRLTPAGNYLYVTDGNIYGSPTYIWSTNKFKTNPDFTFGTNFSDPVISDNLIAFMSVPGSLSVSKLAIYNAANGDKMFTTGYDNNSGFRRVSSNGKYFFTGQLGLYLFSYSNNSFKEIYVDNNRLNIYNFLDFNPTNNEICYAWTSDKKFSIRNSSDFSEIKSYTLNLDEIENIDYYSKRIMGYKSGNVLVYNLEDGTLVREIAADIVELFLYNNKPVLIGNTIYSNHGIKYILN